MKTTITVARILPRPGTDSVRRGVCVCVCVCVFVCVYGCIYICIHYKHTHASTHSPLSTLSLSLTHMLLESSLSECVKGRAWGVRHATADDIEVKLSKPSWGQQQCNRYCSNKNTQQMVLLASLSEEDKEACLKAFTGETCYKCRPADDHVFYLFLQKPKLP